MPKMRRLYQVLGLILQKCSSSKIFFTNGEASPKSGRTAGQKMTVGPFRFKSLELDGNEKKLMSHPMQIEK